jgi:putative acetyltransferase
MRYTVVQETIGGFAVNIRQEGKSDYTTIYNLIKTAFETAKVKDGDGQDSVNELRNSNKYIPELALVAEENGNIIELC